MVAVMFTFSFSTAFAGTAATTAQAELLTDAYEYAQGQINTYFDKAYTAVVKAGVAGYTVKQAAWDALPIKADLEKKLAAVVDAQAKDYTAVGSTAKAVAQNIFVDDLNANAPFVGAAVDTQTALENWIYDAYVVKAALNQYNTDIAKAVSAFDKVDYSLYSTTTPTTGETYYEKAVARVAAGKIAARDGAATDTYELLVEECNESTIQYLAGHVAAFATTYIAPYVDEIEIEGYATGTYKVVGTGILTIEEEAALNVTTAATKASLKALVAQYNANYVTTTGADTELAAAYVTAYNFLIEEDVITSATQVQPVTYFVGSQMVNNAKKVAELEAYAAKYKAEKDADGNLVRDAKEVDKIVTAAKVEAYLDSMTAWAGLTDAKDDIEECTIETNAAEFAFAKEVRKAQLAAAKKAAADSYYALELEKVNAAYDAAIAKVDAAKAGDNLALIDADLFGIKNSGDVDYIFTTGSAASAVDTKVSAIENYITNYLNYGKTVLADDYVSAANIETQLVKYLGKTGVRTAAEVKALDIATFVDTIATNGEIRTAKAEVEAAIKALPATITAADRETVEAAWDKYIAYVKLTGAAVDGTNVTNEDDLLAAADDLYAALNYQMVVKVSKMDKNDKAAVQALAAEYKALNALTDGSKEIFYGKDFVGDDKVTTALTNIRLAEEAAIEKAINAISVNVTEADKAAIEKARELYDAYVAEYTSYTTKVAGVIVGDYAAGDIDNFRELALAEAALGLNDKSEEIAKIEAIASIEGLKIKASSTKGKGWIKVTWKVTGETDAVEGYQLYKSTKAHSGYKKCITTTKTSFKNTKNLKAGTRYYYKVRAYGEVDGVTYYSDWSNKANRVAK